jgi:hypothetical protein
MVPGNILCATLCILCVTLCYSYYTKSHEEAQSFAKRKVCEIETSKKRFLHQVNTRKKDLARNIIIRVCSHFFIINIQVAVESR